MNRKSTLWNNTAIRLMNGAIVADESNRSPSDRIHFMLRGYSQMPSTHSDGIPASPTPAPTIPPTIAAVVSALDDGSDGLSEVFRVGQPSVNDDRDGVVRVAGDAFG